MDCFGFGDCCGGKKNNKIGIEENINNSGIYPSGHYVHNTQYVNPAMPNMYNNTNAYYYGNMNQNVPYPLSDGYLPNNFYTTTAKPTSLKPKPAQYNNNLPNKITTTTTTTSTTNIIIITIITSITIVSAIAYIYITIIIIHTIF